MFDDEYTQKIKNQKPSAQLLERTKQEILANSEAKMKRPMFQKMVAAAAAMFIVAAIGLIAWNPQPANAFTFTLSIAEMDMDGVDSEDSSDIDVPDNDAPTNIEAEVDDTDNVDNDEPTAILDVDSDVPVIATLSDLIGNNTENIVVPMLPYGVGGANRPISVWEHWLVFPINLEFTGTNIDRVLYSIENGSFVDGSPTGSFISLLGREVNTGTMGSDFPLHFAVPYLNPPKSVVFTATATFRDGSQEERVVVLDIENVIALSGITPEELPSGTLPQAETGSGYTLTQIQVALQMQFLRGDWGESWPQVISAERVERDRDYIRFEDITPDMPERPPVDLTNSVRYRVAVRFRQSAEDFRIWEELYRDFEPNPFRRDGNYTIMTSYFYFHDVNGEPVQTFVAS